MLLKPDAVRAGLQGPIAALARRLGLAVRERRAVSLTERDVESCFPEDPRPVDHSPLKFAFCLAYLLDAPAEAWLVAGEDALQRALALKPMLRDRFGRHEFASVVHTPATAAEFGAQLALWFPEQASRPSQPLRDRRRRPPSGWRARLGLDWDRLTALASELAGVSDAELTARIRVDGVEPYVLVLLRNQGRKPEEVVSALVRLVSVPLYDAVTAVYASLVLGQSPVRACSARDAGDYWNALMDEDVLCTVELRAG